MKFGQEGKQACIVGRPSIRVSQDLRRVRPLVARRKTEKKAGGLVRERRRCGNSDAVVPAEGRIRGADGSDTPFMLGTIRVASSKQ